MTTTACRTLLLCSAVAFGALGCASDGDPEDIAASQDIGLGEAADVASEDAVGNAADEEPGAAVTTQRTCPRDPGVPIPVSKDDAFVDCMVSCQSNGGTYGGCHRTCCMSITGCPYCYHQ